jgi:DNA/RNA-binding domain of Phe-tRNA-synthetase-like protein
VSGAPLFRYSDAVLERFPGVAGGVLHAEGVTNGSTPPELAGAYAEEQRRVLERIGDTPLSELPSLAAWRRAFSAFGVEPTKYRSAAEALLRRLTKQGDIPSVSLLVDVGNLVSIRHGLPVAVFDLRGVAGGLTVDFAAGTESFTDLGSSEAERPEPGEVVFVDRADVVHARRWCWRQGAGSATREDTQQVLVTVEGHHPEAHQAVTAAVEELEELLRRFAPGATVDRRVLTAASPTFD